ncbi:hypothetical protein [Jiulongibacter sp. NS-SX5]|uniref:hypothetical protein n=1 Tax=Jiulongibacter sp. NS-SX5 TaxID=3463854 RepID=UPI00405A2412
MKSLHIFWLFYKRLLIPVWGVCLLIGGTSGEMAGQTLASSIIPIGALFHYFVYVLRYPEEYYFFYNLGWSKQKLWVFTLCFHAIICLLITTL